jgi:hypothetical protein
MIKCEKMFFGNFIASRSGQINKDPDFRYEKFSKKTWTNLGKEGEGRRGATGRLVKTDCVRRDRLPSGQGLLCLQ